MNREQRIELGLKQKFKPKHLEVINESDQHSGPPGRESHFKVIIVSDLFEGVSRIERQRQINAHLAEEFESGLHALSQRVYTIEEWQKLSGSKPFLSPECSHQKK